MASGEPLWQWHPTQPENLSSTFWAAQKGEFDVGYPVQAYTLATDSWTTLTAKVDVWRSNGAGKLGNRIYFSGGLTVTDNVTL